MVPRRGVMGFVGELRAPLHNLPSTAHAEALKLLRGKAKLGGELRIPRSLGEPLQKTVSFIRHKSEAASLSSPMCSPAI